MAVLNYTTKISVTQTIGEIQKMLATNGASRISVEYAGTSPSGLDFDLPTPHGVRHFALPVDVDAMEKLLNAEDRAGNLKSGGKGRTSREQSERVAWRVIKDWLAAQLTLVATKMVALDQVLLPYLRVDESGRTLYASYKEHESAALLGAAS